LRICVDSREPRQYFDFLVNAFPSHTFERRALSEGDYATKDVLVERKTLADLYGSVKGGNGKKGRFNNQVNRISCHDSKIIILLLSGDIQKFLAMMKKLGVSIDINVIYGTIASVSCRERMHVIWTEDPRDGLIAMISFMQKVDDGHYMISSRRDENTLLAKFFRFSPTQWKEVRNTFHSLRDLLDASEKDLMRIRGIGKVKAAGIRDLIDKSW
jgi:ERCC4-type nuclease